MTREERVSAFRRLHDEGPLVLPNAWDAASARMMEMAGASAIGTTSAGICWSRGRPDGQTLTRSEMIREIRSIVEAVNVPVTADAEGGYGSGAAADVAETVEAVLEAGAVGVNLEDGPGPNGLPLLEAEVQAVRLAAARDAARSADADLVINARTDVYLAGTGAPETRFDESVKRARVYLEAGADCVFVPGVIDAREIGALVREIPGPLNVMAVPGAPDVGELGRLGVARVSVGPTFSVVALAATKRAATELLTSGTYGSFGALSIGKVDSMFGSKAGGPTSVGPGNASAGATR